jgi:hypothetical protein
VYPLELLPKTMSAGYRSAITPPSGDASVLPRLLLIFRLRSGQLADAVDIPDPDQTEHLGSVTSSCEPAVLSLPGIPWSAQMKRLLHRLLIDHPHDRSVRN